MGFQGLTERVRADVRIDPLRKAFTFLEYPTRGGDARVEHSIAIGTLCERAGLIASRIRRHARPGDPVMLLFGSGPQFVEAFLGCLFAGVVAVPVPKPRRGLAAERVQAILRDCGARTALATAPAREQAEAGLALPSGFDWILVDEADPAEAPLPPEPTDPRAIALLQYSSGSTGEPKGVMITHANLIHQAELLCAEVAAAEGDSWTTWLPIHHDMGLVSGVVAPLAKRLHSVMMSPEAFALRPARWLRALSDFRATCSASPNFGYELCTRKIRDHELDGLDLGCVRVAVSGAEAVRAATIERFVERFGPLGFGKDVICPAYGLAEATLMVTGSAGGPRVHCFETASLAAKAAVPRDAGHPSVTRLVSCGRPCGESRVVIADRDTGAPLPELHIGEIRVSGGSVGQGYWDAASPGGRPFAGPVGGCGEGDFLRTGDLGFLLEGELYVCGRLKDLLVIRGKNHHASDIEQTVEAVDPRLVPSGCAAFAIDAGGEERLVVVQELDRRLARGDDVLDELAMRIRQRVAERHEVIPHEVVLVAGGLPRTSSGKMRRVACRELHLHGDLKPLCVSRIASEESGSGPGVRAAMSLADCEIWLCRQFGAHVRGGDASPTADTPLASLQQDAAAMTAITDAIKREFGLSVPYTAFSDYATISEFAAYLHPAIQAERSSGSLRRGSMTAAQLAALPANETGPRGDEAIAIVGIACRFPDATDPRQFWDNLCRGVESVTDVPPDRWDAEAMYDPNPLAIGKMNTRRGGFLKDVEQFDARFFGIQNREATRMDPAHRLLLELSWEVFEDAGIRPETVSGHQVGVFVGISGSDYAQLQFGDDSLSDPYAGVGCALTNSASRISHFHNLRGPALAIDTACSSSLSAAHVGATAIRTGECEMALVGGVNIILAPNVTMSLSKAGMMAPDGRCKTFDRNADGYVRSEGAGLLLLKPLSRAQADGDEIYAVLRSSATNQDGHGSAISAPNGEAQQRVVKSACDQAGILPGDLDYVEAHGTGTALGDPIEVNSLGELLKMGGSGRVCAIGSVKTNIGHCESAAGAASLIKAAMVLRNGVVPPSLNFDEPNPLIAFDDYPLRVQRELGPLGGGDRPRLAGVNSFGIGGTNVHIVLEEHRPPSRPEPAVAEAPRHRLLPISAKTERALGENARAIADHLRGAGDSALADTCHTLALRRSHLDHRMCVVGQTASELATAIETQLEANHHLDVAVGYHNSAGGMPPKVAFVYSGQGSQWWAMGRRLFEHEPVYRAALERCDAELRKHTGWSVIDVLSTGERDARLEDTLYLQPTLFAVQHAITGLLASWGIHPDAVVGHSFGEITATCVAGAIGFEDACALIAARARLMGETRGKGRMLSVEMPRDALAALLAGHAPEASIAASNSPGATVVSGAPASLDLLTAELGRRGVAWVDLGLDYAFHSSLVESAGEALEAEARGIVPKRPRIALMSTVLADWVGEGPLPDAHYWNRNIREEVRFKDALEAMVKDGTRVFVEIGGHPVLSGAISRTLAARAVQGRVLHTLSREVDDGLSIKRCVAGLHASGVAIEWQAICPDGRFLRGLPHYRWDRKRYWLEAPHHEARARISPHPLVSVRMPVSQPTWQSRLDINAQPWIRPVRMRGAGRLSNGLHVEISLEAAAAASGLRNRRELVDLEFTDQLGRVEDDALPLLQSRALAASPGCHDIRVDVQADQSKGRAEQWMPALACSALTGEAPSSRPDAPDVDGILARNRMKLGGAEIYRKLGEIGVEYVQAAMVASEVHLGEGSALLALRDDLAEANAARCHLHPLLFEAMEQACRLAGGSAAAHSVLRRIRRLRVFGALADARHAYATLREEAHAGGSHAMQAEAWLIAADGTAVALAEGIGFTLPADIDDESAIPADPADWRYHVAWDEQPAHEPVATEAAHRPGHWLVLADAGGVAEDLASRLRRRGQACVLVRPGAAYARAGDTCTVDPMNQGDMERLVRELYADPERQCRGVVHCWNLDLPALADEVPDGYATGVTSLVDVVRALSMNDLPRAPRLALVTCGVQAVGEEDGALAPLQAMAWGCAKSIVHEHAELRCARYDLGAGHGDADLALLCDELLADRDDDQVAFRGGRRFLAKLVPQALPEMAGEAAMPAKGWRRGETDEGVPALVATTRRRRSPGHDEVEIALEAASVDPGAAPGSIDTAAVVGRVVRVGSRVEDITPGQRVVSVATRPLESHITVPAAVTAVADGSPAATAVAASVRAYLCALFGMREVGGVAPGQRVLVRIDDVEHGMPVVQVARWLQASLTVVAPRHLHAMLAGLRIQRMVDEGDPAADAQLGAIGRVEVLVNAAREFHASPSLRRLQPFARCVDLRLDGASRQPMPTGLPANCQYASVDFDHFLACAPDRARAMLAEVGQLLGDGILEPGANPGISIEELAEELAAGQRGAVVALAPDEGRPISPYLQDATYLVTGGLGGLGLALARRMVRDGARHIVLVGRRAPSLAALDAIEEMRSLGADCRALSVDISDAAAVAKMLDTIEHEMPPLRGIIHAAGVLDNGLLVQMGHDQVRSVMPAKVHGAWNLHLAIADRPLDFLVMFSSLASMIGSPGQSNYAAANAFLDALAEHRRREGLPALSIAWGPWSEAGMAADVHNLQRLAQHGMGMVAPEKGLDLLEDLLLERRAGAVGALPMNWNAWARTRGYAAQTAYFASLVSAHASSSSNGRITRESLAAKAPAERMELLLGAIRRAVCNALMLEPTQVELDAPLTSIGLDSIVSLELKDRIESAIDVVVRTNTLVAGKSIRNLAEQFLEDLGNGPAEVVEPGPAVAQPGDAGERALLDRLEGLSNEEIAAMLEELDERGEAEAVLDGDAAGGREVPCD